MFLTLLEHQWKAFYRSHYFKRNMLIKLLVGFTLFIFIISIYRILFQLPAIIEQLYPGSQPHEFIFRQLIFLYIMDLAIRFNIQKVPKQAVKSYLHLPVSRSKLAFYALVKSWFSIYNIYLIALLAPLLSKTIGDQFSAQAFWFIISACFLLGLLNNALIIYIKTLRNAETSKPLLAGTLLVSVGLIWLFRADIQNWSYDLGMAMLSGKLAVFIGLLLLIVGFNVFANRNLMTVLYDMTEQSESADKVKANSPENLFHRIPVYGMFWDLEWKLIMRNKRARSAFYQTPFIIPILVYIFYTTPQQSIQGMLPVLMMAMGSYGFIHLQFTFSWESRFFDFLASKKLDINTVIRSKYYFYVLLASIQFLILSVVVLILKSDIFFLLLGIFLYVIGPAFCLLLYTGIRNSTRIDPNKTAFFNFEGTSGTLFFTIILLFLSIMPFYLIGYLLPTSTITGFSLSAGFTGLCFVVFNKNWISAISRRFVNNKYKYLGKYRET